MEATWIVMGLVGFVAGYALGMCLRHRRALVSLRELLDLRDDYRVKDIGRLQEDVWALRSGLESLGMVYQPGAKTPGRWVKKQS